MLLQEKMAKNKDPKEHITKASFRQLYVVGKGGFGRVWKVEHRRGARFYAMKEMSKAVYCEVN